MFADITTCAQTLQYYITVPRSGPIFTFEIGARITGRMLQYMLKVKKKHRSAVKTLESYWRAQQWNRKRG